MTQDSSAPPPGLPNGRHVSDFIREELEARGWTVDTLASQMAAYDFGIHRLALEMFFAVGPTNPGVLLDDETAEGIARAFGVSPDFFRNLDRAWRDELAQRSRT